MINASQIKAARMLLEWSQKDLSEKSGLSLPTIQRMEKLGPGRSSMENVEKLVVSLNKAGIQFTQNNEPGDIHMGVTLYSELEFVRNSSTFFHKGKEKVVSYTNTKPKS